MDPGVLGGVSCKEAFQTVPASHFGHKLTRAIEQREETVPVHRQQEGRIQRGQSAPTWKGLLAASEPWYIEPLHRIDIRKFGHKNQFPSPRSLERIQEIHLQQWFESALRSEERRVGKE